jgi:hypothetical protein
MRRGKGVGIRLGFVVDGGALVGDPPGREVPLLLG